MISKFADWIAANRYDETFSIKGKKVESKSQIKCLLEFKVFIRV